MRLYYDTFVFYFNFNICVWSIQVHTLGVLMPETITESLKRFNDELDRIKATVSEPSAFSEMYTDRSMPFTFVGFLDRMMSSFAVDRKEDERVLAGRIEEAIEAQIKRLQADRRAVEKYRQERRA